MATLENKIDFVMFFEAIGANVNGDPLNGNMPRTDYDGYGEVSDVCIKRKMRNRMQDLGYPIFVQANDRIVDNLKSLEERFGATFDKKVSDDKVYSMSCEKWSSNDISKPFHRYSWTGFDCYCQKPKSN